MLLLIDENIWFDNEKLYLIKGSENKNSYLFNYHNYPDVSDNTDKKLCRGPTIIYLSSLVCNLQCRYCYAGEGKYGESHKSRFFNFDKYKKTFDLAIKKYGHIKAINFFGGEPLLNFPEIKKFVEYLKDSYDKIPELSFGTNLTIMNEEIKDFIKTYHINIGTSLDGPKSINDSVRVGSVKSVYDEVVKNLNYLSDVDIHKGLQITLSKKHIENYQKKDAIRWIKELEQLPISQYEIVGVFSDDDNLKINLTDDIIKKNYIQFCEDFADYSLEILKEDNCSKPISYLASSIMLKVMKRIKENSCNAGTSFAITPDLKAYPCHMFADILEFATNFDDNFDNNIKTNLLFAKTKSSNTENIDECNKCIAKNLCSYWCKGCTYKQHGHFDGVVESRCIIVKVFTEKVLKFLATEYRHHQDTINKNLHKYHNQRLLR